MTTTHDHTFQSPIQRAAFFSSRLPIILLALIALGGVVMLIYATQEGALMTSPDSRSYVAAARSLMAGQGFLRPYGDVMTQWPPLYPIVIAIIGTLTGQLREPTILDNVRVFNVVNYGVMFFAAGIFFRRCLETWWFTLVGVLMLFGAWSLLIVHVFVWTEPLFILLTLALLLHLPGFLDRPTLRGLVILSAIAALACLQRHAGIALVLIGGVSILFSANAPQFITRSAIPQRVFLWRAGYAAAFGVLASLPLALWFFRNIQLIGKMTGVQPVNFTLDSTFSQTATFARLMTHWYSGSAEAWTYLGPLLTLLILIGAAGLAARGKTSRTLRIAIVFVVVYIVFMVATYSFSRVENSDRMLTPLVIPVTALLLALLERLARWFGGAIKHPYVAYALVTAALALGWGAYPAARVYKEVNGLADNCCADGEFLQSPTIAWLRTHSLDGVLWTNVASELHLYTALFPKRLPSDSDDYPDADFAADQPNYLILMNEDLDPALFSEAYHVELIERFDDGVIYRVRRQSNARPEP